MALLGHPAYENQRKVASANCKKLWQDSEYKDKISKVVSESNKRRTGWQHRAESKECMSKAHFELWKDENFREQICKSMSINHSNIAGNKNPRFEDHRTWDELYGIEKANNLRKMFSERFAGEQNPNFGNGDKICGDKNPSWQGGISFEPYGKEFNKALKEQIRKRDDYQCRDCSILQEDLGYKLNVHHIDFNKKNNDPLNLISFCKSCHGLRKQIRIT